MLSPLPDEVAGTHLFQPTLDLSHAAILTGPADTEQKPVLQNAVALQF